MDFTHGGERVARALDANPVHPQPASIDIALEPEAIARTSASMPYRICVRDLACATCHMRVELCP